MTNENIDGAQNSVSNAGRWLVARLREPSSYMAIAAWLTTIGYTLPGEVVTGISLLGAGIATLVAFAMPEGR